MKYFVVESSSVTLVASMLISPLMGPILAGIFGAVVGDTKLRNLGVVNELISLVICVLSGESINSQFEKIFYVYRICDGIVDLPLD